VSPEDIKALCKELGCTSSELALTLKVDPRTVVLWESGELFPTKRHVERMRALREAGPSAIVRPARGKSRTESGLARLQDPKLWQIVRKLATHPALFEAVAKLSDDYPDPGDDEPR
jgi:transcriptional regulator with XRE-family HTH domain